MIGSGISTQQSLFPGVLKMKKATAKLDPAERLKEEPETTLHGAPGGADGFKEDPAVLALIERVKEKDDRAFQELVERYRNQVAGLAYKMVGDYDDAKDISQIVFVKTYYNLQRFDTTKKFSTWLYRITINASIDYWRKYHKHRHEPLEEVINRPDESQAGPEVQYQRKKTREEISRALVALNDKQRQVFVLRDMEGLDIAEVAKVMNMPQVTVRWYLHRARTKLRTQLVKKRRRMGG